MQRENTYRASVAVDGRDLGVFDKLSGGSVDSDVQAYKPGGLAEAIDLGGTPSTEDVTVQKLYDTSIHSLYHWLVARVGKGAVVIRKQPLDVEGNVIGRPIVYAGRLKTVTAPDVDSEGTGAALLSIVAVCPGRPS